MKGISVDNCGKFKVIWKGGGISPSVFFYFWHPLYANNRFSESSYFVFELDQTSTWICKPISIFRYVNSGGATYLTAKYVY